MERRELKGKGKLHYISFKIPETLHDALRKKAFREKKTISLIITRALEKVVAEGRGGDPK